MVACGKWVSGKASSLAVAGSEILGASCPRGRSEKQRFPVTGCNTAPGQDNKITLVSGHCVQCHIQVFAHQQQLLVNKLIISLSPTSISPSFSTAAAVSKMGRFQLCTAQRRAVRRLVCQPVPRPSPRCTNWARGRDVAGPCYCGPACSWGLGLSRGVTSRSLSYTEYQKPYMHSWTLKQLHPPGPTGRPANHVPEFPLFFEEPEL